jgi:glucosamine--fructose-6-phosphate aminotransferase (isomerizing)
MCGIVAYIGKKQAKNILLDGLKSLEYRGYDSAGIAVLTDDNRVELIKSSGKISELEEKINTLVKKELVTTANDVSEKFTSLVQERTYSALETSNCGIGHTRWATHGSPNDTNAHPHQDSSTNITLVHNGIIKNYFELKEELEREGVEFRSETDTEIIAQLFSYYRNDELSNMAALRKTIKRLEGSFALAILIADVGEKRILLAKNQSPLVIGVGDSENYVASDSSTVLQFTDKILKLKDGQLVELTADSIKIQDIEGNDIKIEVVQSVQTSSILEKGPYKHFLLKEIHEQPVVMTKMLAEAIRDVKEPIQIFNNLDFKFAEISRIVFVACGSAYHSALVGKYLIETWAKIPVEVNLASEYSTNPALVTERDLIIGISQSGETADTIAAITNAKNHGAKIMAITNKTDSAIYELCDPNNYVTPAGIEVSVASTKAFTSQVMSLYLLAIKIAEDLRGINLSEIKAQLRTLPLIVEQTIERAETYMKTCLKFSNYRDFLFLSRGVNYPIALEGALKLKELSYIHATGYPSGEMKHGPIAILDKNVPVLSIAIDGNTELERIIYKKTLSNSAEARARMSPSIVITTDDNKDVEGIFDEVIRVPNISQIFSPIIATIPLQYLAYYIAEDLGKDVDQPRNLAKSVTVE